MTYDNSENVSHSVALPDDMAANTESLRSAWGECLIPNICLGTTHELYPPLLLILVVKDCYFETIYVILYSVLNETSVSHPCPQGPGIIIEEMENERKNRIYIYRWIWVGPRMGGSSRDGKWRGDSEKES